MPNENMVEAIKWVLKIEKDMKDRSGLYGYTQRTMAYNSNKIEGSTLSEAQTAALFEEGYLPSTDSFYKTKDVEEMTGHFLMFNNMLSHIGQNLSEEMIKEFHYELKAGVFEDRANGYAIGDYKTRANIVGNLKEIALPEQVSDRMRELLEWYSNLSEVTLKELAEFHERYEIIHPFQDGNGRTGRVILFRECLEHNIMPFVIHNDNRIEYIAALGVAHEKKQYNGLVNLFMKEQDIYKEKCIFFDVVNRYAQCSSRDNETKNYLVHKQKRR